MEVLPQKSNLSISGVGPLWSLVETVGGLDSYLAFRQPTNQTVGPHHRELGNVKLGARFLWCIKHPIATVVFFVMAPSSSLNRVELCMVCFPSHTSPHCPPVSEPDVARRSGGPVFKKKVFILQFL